MTISMLRPAYAGNAIRIFLSVPSGADRWRLLRKMNSSFSGYDDSSAVPVYDGNDDTCILDTNFLRNGTQYCYRLYCRYGDEWKEDDTKTATCKASGIDGGEDPQMFMRDRLDYGLQELVRAGKLSHQSGHIPVKIAPPTFDGTVFPVVVVQFANGSSTEYGIGNFFGQELNAEENQWQIDDGWLSQIQLSITTWSMNPDERIQLRRAVEFIILSNLEVFDHVGMINMEIQQSDSEDYQSYNVPMYQSVTTASCLSSRYVGHTEERINDISINMDY